MTAADVHAIKLKQRSIVRKYAQANDGRALIQVITVVAMLALGWGAAVWSTGVSLWLTAAAVVLIGLLSVRVFTLMHECGHGSLFRTQRLNRIFGFVLGVISGMPQYVWSRHHAFHHAHNGDWEKYRGLYTTLSVDEYAAKTPMQQWLYRRKCSIAFAPVAGLIYVILNPRLTWFKGSIALASHLARGKIAQPHLSTKEHAASFTTRYWRTNTEYWHMFWNNVALLSIWVAMCWSIGTLRFFTIYLISSSIAGGVGVVLFTVQHNFKHSYASDTKHWNYETGAIEGTSFLVLPRGLAWFTANIGYHHIHHLSSRIPNYRLVRCHNEFQSLFTEVTRVKAHQVPTALKYILWDPQAERIISVADYQQQMSEPRRVAASS